MGVESKANSYEIWNLHGADNFYFGLLGYHTVVPPSLHGVTTHMTTKKKTNSYEVWSFHVGTSRVSLIVQVTFSVATPSIQNLRNVNRQHLRLSLFFTWVKLLKTLIKRVHFFFIHKLTVLLGHVSFSRSTWYK